MDFVYSGFGHTDWALFLNRVAVGLFFAISGWHKLVVPARHQAMLATLQADHVPFIKFNEWFVPTVELFAGVLLAVGAFSVPMALLLGAICLVATCVDGWKRIQEWRPINWMDCFDDFLYLPEVLLGIMILIIVLAGPGALAVH